MNIVTINQRNGSQKGASAIFIVIFASLLLSLIAISFIGLMIREQARSVDDEQSQGAYDAALAGIEDGKRVLIECERDSTSAACQAIEDQDCSTIQDAGIASGTSEVEVNSGATDLNMAYTCVIISRDTEDYLGSLSSSTHGGGDAQLVIPLRPKSTDEFNRIILRWFTSSNAGGSDTVTLPASPTDISLPVLTTGWPTEQPPIIRAQLIQYEDGNMHDADFDDQNYASTLYLKPSSAGSSPVSFTLDGRLSGAAEPVLAQCSSGFLYGGYACEVQLNLPLPPSLAVTTDRVAYLRLSSFYNNADVQVIMMENSTDSVDFDNVQPSIDATGRANDLFRRVETRVEFGSDFPYPRAAVDITDNFCKTFSVGRNPSDFDIDDSPCDPSDP